MKASEDYYSPIPPICLEEVCTLGVDEAGRGPVLGPMVYAVCYLPSSHEQILKNIQVDDSKKLNEEARNDKFKQIQSYTRHIGYAFKALSPQELSKSMLSTVKVSLNSIAHDATIALIQSLLDHQVRIDRVFVDTVGPPASYQRKLSELFPKLSITVAKKADSLYATVSAASIIAKVTRDAYLTNWEFEEVGVSRYIDKDWGSGYPSDPKTIAWLKRYRDPIYGYPGIVRFSWSTIHKVLDSEVKVIWPEESLEKPSPIADCFAKLKNPNSIAYKDRMCKAFEAHYVTTGSGPVTDPLAMTVQQLQELLG